MNCEKQLLKEIVLKESDGLFTVLLDTRREAKKQQQKTTHHSFTAGD